VTGSLTHRIRPAAGEPEGALVLLHGRGADEHDLLPVAEALDPDRRLVAVTPRGPLSLPPGGAHWYVVRRIGYPDPESFALGYGALGAFLDTLPETLGVPWSHTVLGGFSQGAVMSLALGLGAGRPAPAGILALSGFVPTVDGFPLDLERPALPVFLAHGRHDGVIPFSFAEAARDALEGHVRLEFHETPVDHQISPRLVPAMRTWLASALP
jgi:phospholipase/carboxylesterase